MEPLIIAYFFVGAALIFTMIFLVGKDVDRSEEFLAMLIATYLWPLYLLYLAWAWARAKRTKAKR